jgi:hypothetical protein
MPSGAPRTPIVYSPTKSRRKGSEVRILDRHPPDESGPTERTVPIRGLSQRMCRELPVEFKDIANISDLHGHLVFPRIELFLSLTHVCALYAGDVCMFRAVRSFSIYCAYYQIFYYMRGAKPPPRGRKPERVRSGGSQIE